MSFYNETLASDAGANATVSGATFDGVANFTAVDNVGTDSITIAEGSGITSGVAGSNNLSISLWVKANITSAPTTNQDVILFTNDQVQPAMRAMTIRLSVDENGNLKLKLRRNGSTKTFSISGTSKVAVDGSAWSHIFFSLDNATDSMTLYIDNNVVGTTLGWGGGDDWAFDNALILGNSNDSGTAFSGKMARLKIWSEATSATLVQEYYNEGSAMMQVYEANQAPTVLFNETFATDAGTDATASGVTFDGVANFSNSTDAITITGGNGVGSALNDNNGSYSISMWIKADVDESSGYVPLLTDFDQSEGAGFVLSVGTNGNITVSTDGTLGTSNTYDGDSGVDVDGSAWNHIFISADNAADNFELYVNNVKKLDMQGTWMGGGFAADNAITLGNTTDPNFQYLVPFQGKMARVKIWDEASPAGQVNQYYGEGSAMMAVYEAAQISLPQDLAFELKFDHLPQGATNNGNSTFESEGDRTYVSFPTTAANLTLKNSFPFEYTTEDFTVSFWLRPTSAVQGSWAHPFIMDSLGGFGGYYMFQEASVHNTYGFVGNSSSSWTDPDPNMAMSVDTWTHLTFVREGTQSKIYINGQLDSINANDVAATIGWSQSQLMIGHEWVGDISDFRIWSRALDTSEAVAVYNLSLDTTLVSMPNPSNQWLLQTGVEDSLGGTASTSNGIAFINDGDLNRPVANYLGDGSNFSISNTLVQGINDNGYTLSMWVNPSSLPSNEYTLFSDWLPNVNYPSLRVLLNDDGGISVKHNPSNSSSFQVAHSSGSLSLNKWTQVVIAWSANDTEFGEWGNGLTMYINGELDSTHSNIDAPPYDATQNMVVGAAQNANGEFYNEFVGRLADIRFWNEKLDPPQATTLYTHGVKSETEALIAHYTFDSLSNATGNTDYDLVAYNGASVSDGVLLLPNANSGVYPANEILIDQNGNDRFTVSMWFKDLANRHTRDNGFMQFLADHPVSPAGSTSHQGVANYLVTIYENDELGVYDHVEPHSFESTGFQMLPANYTGWHQLVILHDNGTTTFYVDGVQAGVPVSFTPTDVIQVFGSFGQIDLGSGNMFNPQNSPAAAFDNIRVYNDLLSASEISDLYALETPPTLETGLIARFPLDNASEIIGGHTGVLGHQAPATSTPSFVDDSGYRFLNLTERGQGLTFSNTGLLEDLPHTSSWSISAWVKIPEYVTNTTRINYFGNDAASIFCKGSLIGGGNVLSMALEQGYPLLWHRKPNHGAFTQATVQVQLNTWTHLLVTIEGGPDNVTQGTIRWYVDGQAAGEGFNHPGGWYGVTAAESANQDIVIGGAPVTNAWPAMRFLGDIDDIRVWDRVISAEEAGRLHSEGRAAALVSIFTSILGRKEFVDYSFPTPNPHGGWVFVTDFGNSFESGSGDQVLSGPTSIPNAGSSLNAPESLIKVGGFWFTLVSGSTGIGSQFQANDRVSYANAIDANGNSCFPSENGWTNIADAQTGTGWSRALYSDGQNAYMTVVNDEVSSGDFKSRLYIASVASDNTSVPTWSQLNTSASWNGQSITGSLTDTNGNAVTPALSVKKGAAFMTKHIWVCKDKSVDNQFGCNKIVIYDMNNGTATMHATLANLPVGVVDLQIPHYCPQSAAWFVPYRGGILKSVDGGLNWSKKEVLVDLTLDDGSTINDAVEVNSVCSATNGTLVAVGVVQSANSTDYGVIIRSEDDGETWQIAALNANRLFSVEVAGEGIWVVGGENNLLGASLDDGYVWVDLDYVDSNNAPGQTISAINYGGLF